MKPSTDRRSDKERRIATQKVSFPMHDCNGTVVTHDRRITADRRTEGLDVTLADMPIDTFNEYFKNFQQDDSQ